MNLRMRRRVTQAAALLLMVALVACGGSARTAGVADRGIRQGLDDHQNELNVRRALFDALKPVTLKNCVMKRFGSANDGGYVMCANLLQDVKAAYSYGIGGNDDWGCEVSKTFKVPVHQYDCFEPPNLSCPGGQFIPHNECVGPIATTEDRRVFDTVQNQIRRNGDRGRRLLVKMDIEGAEWKSILATPDDVLARFDQLPMELHGTSDPLFLDAVGKLKRNFYLVHLHFNNYACQPDLAPFPAGAFQVLFVNKRVGILGTPQSGDGTGREFDAPDSPQLPDCQLPSA
jgi:hypothetical protein